MNAMFERATSGIIQRWGQLSSVWKKLVKTDFAYKTTVSGELNRDYVREEDFRPYMEHLGRMDMRVFARLARDMRSHSAADVLTSIDVPRSSSVAPAINSRRRRSPRPCTSA